MTFPFYLARMSTHWRRIKIIFLAALSFSLTIQAADDFFDSGIRVTHAAVEIDADGRVTAMKLDDLNENLTMQLREYILYSTFEPAQKNGHTTASSTHLIIRYRLTAESATGASLRVLSIDNGPMAVKRFGLRYPTTAIMRRIQGLMLVRATVNPDGTTSNVHVSMQWPANRSLSRTATGAVKKWKFQPDKVDGVAISSDVLIPIQFCIEHCRENLTPASIQQLMSNAPSPSDALRPFAQDLPILPLVQVVASKSKSENSRRRIGIGKGRFRNSGS